MENDSHQLTNAAYGWCAVIWENRQSCEDWERFLFLSLEIGFRRFEEYHCSSMDLMHTDHHQELAKAVFRSNNIDAIAYLLWALRVSRDGRPAVKSFSLYKQYIVDLPNNIPVPFPQRLQRTVCECVEIIGFEEVEPERIAGFLNHLHIGVGETTIPFVLLKTAQSQKGHHHLATHSWESLVQAIINWDWGFEDYRYTPHVTSSLLENQEWDKLECWMAIVWVLWPPVTEDVAEDLKQAMEVLFHKKPSAVQKLTQWVEQGWKEFRKDPSASFQQICKQGHEATL